MLILQKLANIFLIIYDDSTNFVQFLLIPSSPYLTVQNLKNDLKEGGR